MQGVRRTGDRVLVSETSKPTYSPEFVYTVATGRLFMQMADFHRAAEECLGRPVMTHEFASQLTWRDLNTVLEEHFLEAAQSGL